MIVVTGAAGFIGSVLVWKLNGLGADELLLVDQNTKDPKKIKNIAPRRFKDLLESHEFLKRLESGKFKKGEISAVFHMGACTDTTEMDSGYLGRNNFEYTKTLAEWSLWNGARFLYASSAATYGALQGGYSDADEVTLGLKPLNPYGVSKQEFDLWALCKKWTDRIAGFKFFNVFGPNEYHKGAMRSVVHKGYEQIKAQGVIRLFKSYRPDFGDGEQRRDFVYVKDVAEAVCWFWQNPEKNGIYNIGTGRARSWNDLARAIFGALKLPVRIEYIEMPANLRNQYQYHTEADLSKLRAAGFRRPFMSLEDSVSDYVLNYLERSDPYL